VQKVAWYASVCLIMGPFKGEKGKVMARSTTVACAKTPSYSRWPGNTRIKVRVSFATGAVRLAILATAGLLVL